MREEVHCCIHLQTVSDLILTISLMIEGNYGLFSTVSMVAITTFAGIKAIENIINEIE